MSLSGIIHLQRPVDYSRRFFQIGSNTEKVGYSGLLFSQPAYAALLDLRLFSIQHPISSPIFLYYNKDVGLIERIEPDILASGYERATPHYVDYILDIRNTLSDVHELHSEDSDWAPNDFLVAQLNKARQIYNLDSSSRSGVKEFEYINRAPDSMIPSNDELGASGIFDIDMDEIMWRAFPRPKNFRSVSNGIPIQPIFPAVLTTEGLPTFSLLDDTKYTELAVNAPSSGGLLLTGDRLLLGTKLFLGTTSGEIITISDYLFDVPGAEYPVGSSLAILGYQYTTDQNFGVSVSGRQAIYATPNLTAGVYLFGISDVGQTSGYNIQHYPSNYNGLSGIDINGKAHNGLHIQDRLIYSVNEFGAGQPAFGRSLINGKIVFAHFGATDLSERGNTFGAARLYENNNSVFGYAGILDAAFGNEETSRTSWVSVNNLLSPATWFGILTTALEPFRIPFSTPPQYSTSYDIGDVNASLNDGTITRKFYSQWGVIDQIVYPDQNFGLGGQLRSDPITYTQMAYRPIDINQQTGEITWAPVEPPEQFITVTTVQAKYFADTFFVNNVWTLFFARRPNHGFVHVNGSIYVQWSDSASTTPRNNKFAPLGTRTFRLEPATNRSDVIRITQNGLRRFVTNNNQITVPDQLTLTPTTSTTISINPDLPIATSDIRDFGPAIWDPSSGNNYLYFVTNNDRVFFAKMNTSFEIFHINQVDESDGIIFGRSIILDL